MNLITGFKNILKKILPQSTVDAIRGRKIRLNVKNVHSFFDLETIYKGHHEVTYRGVNAVRCPFDYVLYQMLVHEVKPDLIIEIGTHRGGGALYLADLLEKIGDGVVHTIDIRQVVDSPLVLNNPRIKLFTEGWEKYDLELARGYSRVMVIEDGAHTYEQSIGAINRFHHLVTPSSYLVVEDGIVDDLGMKERFGGGPVRAIEEFLQKNHDFFIDRKWCDFFGQNATFNVNGFLKRKP
jgi:cephalosporin hydroxylase